MNETPHDVLLNDPLRELTRKERKVLLATSMVGLAMVKVGLVPTKISALGIDFDKTNQQAFYLVVGILLAYFLCAFLIYAVVDFVVWQRVWYKCKVPEIVENEIGIYPDDLDMAWWQLWENNRTFRIIYHHLPRPVAYIRLSFEIVLPLAIGIYSLWLVFSAAFSD